MDNLLLKISALSDLAELGVQNVDSAQSVLIVLKDELDDVYNKLGVISDARTSGL